MMCADINGHHCHLCCLDSGIKLSLETGEKDMSLKLRVDERLVSLGWNMENLKMIFLFDLLGKNFIWP